MRINSVEAKGKTMLILLSSIYSHNQLYGEWTVVPYKSYPDYQTLVLSVDSREWLFSPALK